MSQAPDMETTVNSKTSGQTSNAEMESASNVKLEATSPSVAEGEATAEAEAAADLEAPETSKTSKQPSNVKAEPPSSSSEAEVVVAAIMAAAAAAAAEMEAIESFERRQRSKGKAKVASSSFAAPVDLETPESLKKTTRKNDGASCSRAAAVVAAPLQQDSGVAEPFGRWPELHEELLAAVVGLLPSLRDVCAMASVCRPWRSFVRSSRPHAGRPPLLVRPVLRQLVEPIPKRRGRRSRRLSPWIDPRRCEFLCPTAGPRVPPLPALVSSAALSHKFLGASHGRIIFISDAERLVIVVDPFSGAEVRPPRLPSDAVKFNLGALTAPFSKPGCKLVLTGDTSVFFLWAVGSENWTRAVEVTAERMSVFWGIIQVHDQIFALDIESRLFAASFSPELRVRQLRVRWEEGPGGSRGMINGHQFLIECAGELMLVQAAPTGVLIYWSFLVYRLDLSSRPLTWRKVHDLGDWSLFVDSRSAVACESPGRWGGQSNCIYYIGRGCNTWYVYPLSKEGNVNMNDPHGPFHRSKAELPLWPSPLWLYPTHF